MAIVRAGTERRVVADAAVRAFFQEVEASGVPGRQHLVSDAPFLADAPRQPEVVADDASLLRESQHQEAIAVAVGHLRLLLAEDHDAQDGAVDSRNRHGELALRSSKPRGLLSLRNAHRAGGRARPL